MCGRYALVHSADQLQLIFHARGAGGIVEARFNIAPTQMVPVVLPGGGERVLRAMRWGLIPHWAKDDKIGARLINARAETAAELPSFRGPFERRRCVVPASGFYEWKAGESGKVPYYIHDAAGDPLAFAGLWDRWTADADHVVESCTILTTEPNEVLRPLHDRMPVILDLETTDAWLESGKRDAPMLRALLGPCPSDRLALHPVSRRVNRVENDDPSLIEPAPETPGPGPSGARRKKGDDRTPSLF